MASKDTSNAKPRVMTTTEISLAIAASTAAGLFAGSAMYITAVQHPALLTATIPSAARAAFFKDMFGTAAPLQASLAVISGATAIATGVLEKQRGHGTESTATSTLWIVSGSTIAAIVPYTMVTMMKLNLKLIDTDFCVKQGESWLMQSLVQWGQLHSVRSGVSVVAFAGMVIAMSGTLRRTKTRSLRKDAVIGAFAGAAVVLSAALVAQSGRIVVL